MEKELMLMVTQVTDETHEYVLQRNEEFRFEVDFETKVEIQVLLWSLKRLIMSSSRLVQRKYLGQR